MKSRKVQTVDKKEGGIELEVAECGYTADLAWLLLSHGPDGNAD